MNKIKFLQKALLTAALGFFLTPCFCFAQEQISLTTYYPAPFGIYFDLHSDKMAVGSGYRAITSVPDGALAVQNGVGINTTNPGGARILALMTDNNSRFVVNSADNVNVELKSNGGTPNINFYNDMGASYDMRIILTGDDVLSIQGGTLRADDVYLSNPNYGSARWASAPPSIPFQLVKQTSTSGGGHLEATAYCPTGYTRVGCSGSREENLVDTCDESACGFIGAVPVVSEGCRVGIDGCSDCEATAIAYCLKLS